MTVEIKTYSDSMLDSEVPLLLASDVCRIFGSLIWFCLPSYSFPARLKVTRVFCNFYCTFMTVPAWAKWWTYIFIDKQKMLVRQKAKHMNLRTIITVKSCNSHEIQTYFSLKTVFKVFLHFWHGDFVLRSFRATAAGNHCVEIQFYNLRAKSEA